MLKKISVSLMAVLLIVSILSGCAKPTPALGASEIKEAKQYKFVFIVKSMQFPFFLSMIEGAEAAAKLLPNVSIKCVGPETPYSVEEQIQLVEQAITDGVDAILIAPADSKAIVPAILKANTAGILVATPNTKAYGGDVLTWTGGDNYRVGYELGKVMLESIKGVENVLLIEEKPGNSTSEERVEGYLAAFKEYPKVVLLDSQLADFNREKDIKLTENWLQKYKKIDAIGSINKDMTLGAVEAAKAVGRNKEFIQVTFDVDNDGFDALEPGDILVTGVQD